MKRYLQRYIHHIGGLPDFTALRFTRYNQYESMILPMVKYLEGFGVQFHYNTKVTDVKFDIQKGRKLASSVTVEHAGETSNIDLTENDLVFITNGGCVENSSRGSQNASPSSEPCSSPVNLSARNKNTMYRTPLSSQNCFTPHSVGFSIVSPVSSRISRMTDAVMDSPASTCPPG